jgi:endonuclease YncB( thermonuclease family)
MRLRLRLIILLILLSGASFWMWTGDVVESVEKVYVSRVIDGDTIELDSGLKIRLKGLNTPETDMILHLEAKEFLSSLVLEREIIVKSFGGDKYGRVLGYVYVDGGLVNSEILRKGFGGLYYYEKDPYYAEMFGVEEFARANELGIWKRSDNYGCIELVEFEIDEPEKIILDNRCGYDLDVVIKDDATHIYEETLGEGLWEKEFSHIWNTGGDSLYVWDEKGLILFERY